MGRVTAMSRDREVRLLSVFCGWVVTLLGLSAIACGNGGGSDAVDAAADPDAHVGADASPLADSDTGGDSGAPSGPGFQPLRVGHINLVEGGGAQSVYASIRNKREVPAPELLASSGDCAVWVHPGPALCEPPCSDGFCVDTNTCETWPQFAPAGTITVTGLEESLSFVPGSYWYDAEPFPGGVDLFATGAAISASAPGDVSEGFSLSATGVAPLQAEFPVTLELEDNVDKPITWTAAGDSRIQLALLVGWHGAPYQAMLLCETEDDGSLTIPGSLIAQFPRASSPMEQHYSWLVRFDRDVHQTGAGPVELFVGSMVIITQLSHP